MLHKPRRRALRTGIQDNEYCGQTGVELRKCAQFEIVGTVVHQGRGRFFSDFRADSLGI
jgi:hypothetical protein